MAKNIKDVLTVILARLDAAVVLRVEALELLALGDAAVGLAAEGIDTIAVDELGVTEEVDNVLGVILVDFVVSGSLGERLAVDDGSDLVSRGDGGGVGQGDHDGSEGSDGELHFDLWLLACCI